MTITRIRTAAVTAVALGSLAAAPVALAEGARQTSAGAFHVLPAAEGTAFEDAHGVARIVRSDRDGTTLAVRLVGLEPDTTYPAHLHAAPCTEGGGGHYMHDPSGPAAPPNELWPAFTTDDKGQAYVSVSAPWVARAEAEAVVVHQPGVGTKVLCAQL